MIPLLASSSGGLDLSLAASLSPLWTFTRASGGTYTPTASTLATAGSNIPRFDALGYLNEPQATNLLLHSQSVGGTSWSNNQNSATFTPTTNNAVAPDGTTTATKVVASAVGAGGWAFTAQLIASSAAAYSRSIWLKGEVGGETVYLISTLGASSYTKTTCVLTTAWQRFTLNNVTETATNWYTYIGVDRRDATQADPGAQTYYVWQAGDELGAFATSDIVTVGSTSTRAADNLTLALSQLPGLQTAAGYCVALDFAMIGVPASGLVVPLGLAGAGGAFVNGVYAQVNASNQISFVSVVASASVSSGLTALNSANISNKIALSITPSGVRFSVNGGAVVAVANAGQPAMTSLGVGGLPPSSGNTAAMHATKLSLVPGPQSDAWLMSRST